VIAFCKPVLLIAQPQLLLAAFPAACPPHAVWLAWLFALP